MIGLFKSADAEFTTENATLTTESAEDGSFTFGEDTIPYGTFLSYHIDRDGVTYCKYLAIKKDAPLSKIRRLFTEIDDEDFDFRILGDVTESIGSKVLEALGNMCFCNKGGASNGE